MGIVRRAAFQETRLPVSSSNNVEFLQSTIISLKLRKPIPNMGWETLATTKYTLYARLSILHTMVTPHSPKFFKGVPSTDNKFSEDGRKKD